MCEIFSSVARAPLRGLEGASRWLAACQSLEWQRPQAQGSADHDNNEAYYDDNEAKDYHVRIGSGVAWITHDLSITPNSTAGNSPFRVRMKGAGFAIPVIDLARHLVCQ